MFKKSLLTAAMIALSGVSTAALAATATSSFHVYLTITSTCSVTAGNGSDIDFGSHPSTDTNLAASNTISVTCSSNTPYDIGLLPTNAGGTASGTGNLLTADAGSADSVPYALWRDAQHSAAWGNDIGNNTLHGSGTGAADSKTVYATVASANYTPDSYSDLVNVTVTY